MSILLLIPTHTIERYAEGRERGEGVLCLYWMSGGGEQGADLDRVGGSIGLLGVMLGLRTN